MPTPHPSEADCAAELDFDEPSRAPWRIATVECRPNMQLAVCFLDGTSGVVSLRKMLTEEPLEGTVFEPLADPAFFIQVHLERGAVTWPNGADIAPDAMHEAILASGGTIPEM